MHAVEADEYINSVEQQVSNPNFNDPSVKPKHKAGDLGKCFNPEDMQKSTESKSNHEIEIEVHGEDNDVETTSPTTGGIDWYCNVAGIKRGIPVGELADYVAKRDKDHFEQEFNVGIVSCTVQHAPIPPNFT